jgi:hypothetical protein
MTGGISFLSLSFATWTIHAPSLMLGEARCLEPLDEARDQVIDIALALPEVERDIQEAVVDFFSASTDTSMKWRSSAR